MTKESSPNRPRRFAPLNPEKQIDGEDLGPRLKGIVFDVDGTLCEPQNYMFAEMRAALNITKGTDILDHIYTLPDDEQETAMEKVRNIERKAMRAQKPQAGLAELMAYVDSRGLRKGICTRNFDTPVAHLLTTFLPTHTFTPIITREFRPPKPDPAGILHIAAQWGVAASSLLMVGDSIDDMTAGYRAGAATVLLVNEANAHLAGHQHTDLCVGRLDDLIPILENGFEGQIGQGEENPDTRAQAEAVLKQEE